MYMIYMKHAISSLFLRRKPFEPNGRYSGIPGKEALRNNHREAVEYDQTKWMRESFPDKSRLFIFTA